MDLLLVRHDQPLDEMRTKRAQRRRPAQKPISPWQWATERRTADEYQRHMEMAREEPWKHLWPDYSGPDSEQDSFPTWQEFESYQRAFPWLFQEEA